MHIKKRNQMKATLIYFFGLLGAVQHNVNTTLTHCNLIKLCFLNS